METITVEKLRELAQQIPGKIPYLKMLVLFGSRATGNTHQNSDWDFAVLYDEEKRNAYIKNDFGKLFELPILIGEVLGINSDIIDVVELNHCSWLSSTTSIMSEFMPKTSPISIGEVLGINSDIIDVVELNHCSWLIAHFIARDGILIFEKDPHGFEYFQLTSLRPESELKKYREDQHRLIQMNLKV